MPNTREKLIELIQTAKSKKQYDFLFGNIDDAIDMKSDNDYIADNLIANGVTVQKWIPVSERLPEPLTQVLSYGHGCFEVNMVDGGVWDNEYYSEYSVTHWMPLPEPPKGE